MSELEYKYYSSVKSKEVDWLWYPYIPYGKLSIIQGDPGEGKSTFIINILSLLTRGKPMPDGYTPKKPENAIYQCAEDNLADTIKPRLVSAKADCSKVAYIIDRNFELSFEDSRIEEAILKINAKLFVIDPLQAFLVQDTDMQSAAKMRSALRKLSDVAERTNCAIVLVGHLNKANGEKNLYRGLGSIDIAAIARSVLMIARDKNDSSIRYMFPIKSSLAPEGEAIRFSFDNKGKIKWFGKCNINPNSINISSVSEDTKQKRAEHILLELLGEKDMSSSYIYEHLKRFGISQRTAEVTKKKLGIVSYRKGKAWYWKIPN